MVRHIIYYIIFIPYLQIVGCGQRYDPDLETPDCCGTGYVLTSLGSLIYSPWEADPEINASDVSTYQNTKLLTSAAQSYDPVKSQLVFELHKNGSIKYWFKKNYTHAPTDTTVDKSGTTTITKYKPREGQIKNIYTSGFWKANFRDSTLKVSLGDNNSSILLEGKYTILENNRLVLSITTHFDTTINHQVNNCIRVITTTYSHPWINEFNK